MLPRMQTLVFRKVGSHSSPQSMNLVPGVRAVLGKDDVEAQHYVRSRRDDFRSRGLVLSYEVRPAGVGCVRSSVDALRRPYPCFRLQPVCCAQPMRSEALVVHHVDDDEPGEAEAKDSARVTSPGTPSRLRARLGAMVHFSSKRDRGTEQRQRSRTVSGTTQCVLEFARACALDYLSRVVWVAASPLLSQLPDSGWTGVRQGLAERHHRGSAAVPRRFDTL